MLPKIVKVWTCKHAIPGQWKKAYTGQCLILTLISISIAKSLVGSGLQHLAGPAAALRNVLKMQILKSYFRLIKLETEPGTQLRKPVL